MKTKASHYGTCQLCGSLQKLPNGVLASHGYQIEWNQFHGICSGSGRAPFEQSKDFAEAEIVRCTELLETHPALPQPINSDWRSRWNDDDVVAYRARRDARRSWQGMIGWLKPRCENWSVKPLREVAEEDRKAETVKVASRNVRQLAGLRNDAKWALSLAIDKVTDHVGYFSFGSITSATCVKVAGLIAASRGISNDGYRESKFDLDEAMALVSHMLTAHAVWIDAKAKADDAKAAYEADKKAAQAAQEAELAA